MPNTVYTYFETQFSAPKLGEMIGKQTHKLSFELQLNTLYPEDRNKYNFRIIFGTPYNDQTPESKQSYVQHTTVRTL